MVNIGKGYTSMAHFNINTICIVFCVVVHMNNQSYGWLAVCSQFIFYMYGQLKIFNSTICTNRLISISNVLPRKHGQL